MPPDEHVEHAHNSIYTNLVANYAVSTARWLACLANYGNNYSYTFKLFKLKIKLFKFKNKPSQAQKELLGLGLKSFNASLMFQVCTWLVETCAIGQIRSRSQSRFWTLMQMKTSSSLTTGSTLSTTWCSPSTRRRGITRSTRASTRSTRLVNK